MPFHVRIPVAIRVRGVHIFHASISTQTLKKLSLHPNADKDVHDHGYKSGPVQTYIADTVACAVAVTGAVAEAEAVCVQSSLRVNTVARYLLVRVRCCRLFSLPFSL